MNRGAVTRTLAFVVAVYACVLPSRTHAQTVTRGPYLQLSTETSIVIRWRTDVPTDSRVRYGYAPGSLSATADDPTSVTDHVVNVTGLSSATQYFYSVGTSSAELAGNDAETYFVTHPPISSVQPVRIWAIGDFGWGNAGQMDVRDRYYAYAAGTHTDLWLQLGDNAYSNGTDSEFGSNNFAVYSALYRKSVAWPCIGNHEGIGAGYYPAFTLPTSAQAGGIPSGTEAYYSFDFANIHFINLDSQNSNRAVGGAMYNWLTSDLQNTSQDWIIAYWHHPPYSKGSHNSDTEGQLIDMRENFLPLLESHGVDLVLSGHSHSYERSQFIDGHHGDSTTFSSMSHVVQSGDGDPAGDGAYSKLDIANDGAVYSVVGSSGTTSGGSLNHAAMQVSLNVLGSMVIDVNDHQLDAIMLDDAGATRDTFRIVKMDATPSPTATMGSHTPTPTSTTTPTATTTPGAFGDFTPIAAGSVWKFEDSDSDLLTPDPKYYESAYSDALWSSGAGPLGFGDPYIVTTTAPGIATTYFRKSFTVSHAPAAITSLLLTANYDDGFVLYLNGQEVLRQGVASGPYSHGTLSSSHEGGAYSMFDLTAHADKLVLGSNLLAVDVHQTSLGSSDLGWDATLAYHVPEPTPTRSPTATATPGIATCDASPRMTCSSTTRASFKQRGGLIEAAHRQILFKWLMGALPTEDLGNPVTGTTSYALCVYGDGTLLSTSVVTADGDWISTATGFRYVNSPGDADGITKVVLKGGAGNAKLLLKARGAGLDATLPMIGTTSVVVQFVKDPNSGPECWEAILPAPALKHDSEQFKDRIP